MSTFLDTNAEIHAVTHGIYAGMTEWKGMELPDNEDIQKEPHYFKGGYIAGTILRYLLLILVARGIYE
jgi:hypothetical protein